MPFSLTNPWKCKHHQRNLDWRKRVSLNGDFLMSFRRTDPYCKGILLFQLMEFSFFILVIIFPISMTPTVSYQRMRRRQKAEIDDLLIHQASYYRNNKMETMTWPNDSLILNNKWKWPSNTWKDEKQTSAIIWQQSNWSRTCPHALNKLGTARNYTKPFYGLATWWLCLLGSVLLSKPKGIKIF